MKRSHAETKGGIELQGAWKKKKLLDNVLDSVMEFEKLPDDILQLIFQTFLSPSLHLHLVCRTFHHMLQQRLDVPTITTSTASLLESDSTERLKFLLRCSPDGRKSSLSLKRPRNEETDEDKALIEKVVQEGEGEERKERRREKRRGREGASEAEERKGEEGEEKRGEEGEMRRGEERRGEIEIGRWNAIRSAVPLDFLMRLLFDALLERNRGVVEILTKHLPGTYAHWEVPSHFMASPYKFLIPCCEQDIHFFDAAGIGGIDIERYFLMPSETKMHKMSMGEKFVRGLIWRVGGFERSIFDSHCSREDCCELSGCSETATFYCEEKETGRHERETDVRAICERVYRNQTACCSKILFFDAVELLLSKLFAKLSKSKFPQVSLSRFFSFAANVRSQFLMTLFWHLYARTFARGGDQFASPSSPSLVRQIDGNALSVSRFLSLSRVQIPGSPLPPPMRDVGERGERERGDREEVCLFFPAPVSRFARVCSTGYDFIFRMALADTRKPFFDKIFQSSVDVTSLSLSSLMLFLKFTEAHFQGNSVWGEIGEVGEIGENSLLSSLQSLRAKGQIIIQIFNPFYYEIQFLKETTVRLTLGQNSFDDYAKEVLPSLLRRSMENLEGDKKEESDFLGWYRSHTSLFAISPIVRRMRSFAPEKRETSNYTLHQILSHSHQKIRCLEKQCLCLGRDIKTSSLSPISLPLFSPSPSPSLLVRRSQNSLFSLRLSCLDEAPKAEGDGIPALLHGSRNSEAEAFYRGRERRERKERRDRSERGERRPSLGDISSGDNLLYQPRRDTVIFRCPGDILAVCRCETAKKALANSLETRLCIKKKVIALEKMMWIGDTPSPFPLCELSPNSHQNKIKTQLHQFLNHHNLSSKTLRTINFSNTFNGLLPADILDRDETQLLTMVYREMTVALIHSSNPSQRNPLVSPSPLLSLFLGVSPLPPSSPSSPTSPLPPIPSARPSSFPLRDSRTPPMLSMLQPSALSRLARYSQADLSRFDVTARLEGLQESPTAHSSAQDSSSSSDGDSETESNFPSPVRPLRTRREGFLIPPQMRLSSSNTLPLDPFMMGEDRDNNGLGHEGHGEEEREGDEEERREEEGRGDERGEERREQRGGTHSLIEVSREGRKTEREEERYSIAFLSGREIVFHNTRDYHTLMKETADLLNVRLLWISFLVEALREQRGGGNQFSIPSTMVSMDFFPLHLQKLLLECGFCRPYHPRDPLHLG